MTRAALYLRLSAVAEDSTSIARQERDLRELAERRGWTVEALLADEGVSGRKARANAEEAVRMLADDEVDVLAVWKLDRFTRQGWDGLGGVSRALDGRERAGRPGLFVALQDGLDSTQPAFRLIAGVLSEVARTEAENGATRSRNAMHYRRTVSDRFTGGGTVPFGYRSAPAPDGVGRVLELEPAEAAIVRETAAQLLDGVGTVRAARELTERGIPTSKSEARKAARRGDDPSGLDRGRWTASTVAALWTADSLLGRQTHRGDLVRDADGLPRAVWPPILDLATLEQLRAQLRPSTARPVRVRASRLLSGLAFCGSCGAPLYATASKGRAAYRCRSAWNGEPCPSQLSIDALALEEHVSGAYLSIVGAHPDVRRELVVVAPEVQGELREVEAAIRELQAALGDDDVDEELVLPRLRRLKARRTELRATPSSTTELLIPSGLTNAEAWTSALDVEKRRERLGEALDHVAVAPARRRGAFDAERVRLFWRS